jgi:hypothetical protein
VVQVKKILGGQIGKGAQHSPAKDFPSRVWKEKLKRWARNFLNNRSLGRLGRTKKELHPKVSSKNINKKEVNHAYMLP